jgi:cytochrome c peroxidase
MWGYRKLVKVIITAVLLVFGIAVLLMVAPSSTPLSSQSNPYIPKSTKLAISPIPDTLKLDQSKVRLGGILFQDKRLSADNTIACSSCHDLKHAGQDGRAVAVGINGSEGSVNSPSVFNSGFGFRQFWDGRAATLEEQAAGPVHNPIEMGSNWEEVIAKLNQDHKLVAAFNSIWKDGITASNIQGAIAEFERSLITPNSPFDRYLKGDDTALTEKEKHGWRLFRDLGCVSCHQGVGIGNNMYANLGVMDDYFSNRGRPITKSDLGRFNVTGDEKDMYVFKVPGLRNVALTAPYFHDGSIATLDKVVYTMARYQLGVSLDKQQIDYLVAFLTSLTGVFPEEQL